ncbi:LysR family transcriptional regulator [Marinobacter sp. DUT-3]|uniref:LysR family transcriptional regulator n=1 Tax=Marinobacter sp. DUT-3 TaxID=3412036 RepID=UPI003D18002C
MYDLKELEAFAVVIRSGSLSLSARELDLPKSTLSRRIRQLESSVGQPLLRRESNQLIPNEAGRVFYKYCNEMLVLAQQGSEALNELRENITGELVLRSHEAFIRGWFAQVTETFMTHHQGVNIRVHTQTQAPSDQVDGVCLWLGDPGESPLRQELLGSLTQGVYGHPDYLNARGRPQNPGDLGQHTWVDLLGNQPGSPALTLHHSRHGIYPLQPPVSCLQFDQYCLQGDAIVRKQGLGLMPHWMVERRLQAHPGTLELCLPEWRGPSLPVWLLYPHGSLPRRVRAFLSHVRNSIPQGWCDRHAA